MDFPESARKQDFHLDDAKRSREQIHDTGKEQAALMFQTDDQQSWWHFQEKSQQFTSKACRMVDNWF